MLVRFKKKGSDLLDQMFLACSGYNGGKGCNGFKPMPKPKKTASQKPRAQKPKLVIQPLGIYEPFEFGLCPRCGAPLHPASEEKEPTWMKCLNPQCGHELNLKDFGPPIERCFFCDHIMKKEKVKGPDGAEIPVLKCKCGFTIFYPGSTGGRNNGAYTFPYMAEMLWGKLDFLPKEEPPKKTSQKPYPGIPDFVKEKIESLGRETNNKDV